MEKKNCVEISFTKCGEIFVNENGRLRWQCVICGQEDESGCFSQHVLKEHFSELCEIKRKPYDVEDKKILDFSAGTVNKDCNTFQNNSANFQNILVDNNFLKQYNIKKCLKICLERTDLSENSQNQTKQVDKKKMPTFTNENRTSKTFSNFSKRDGQFHTITKKIESNSDSNLNIRKSDCHLNIRKCNKHVCEVCGKESTTKYNLNSHIKLKHSNSERKKYPCKNCKKLFVTLESLQNHIKTIHLKLKPFICSINMCERRFVNERALKNHQAFHTSERKFVCSKCGKKYLHKSKLDAHFKVYHVLGRIHQCNDCDKSFYDQYTLRRHMICHTNAKPFVCDECPSKFPREKALEWHKKVHSGIKDYICKICGQAYHLYTGLYSHMKTHGIKYNKKIEKGLVPIEKLLSEKLTINKNTKPPS